ncbi:hypothetical protein LOTGIDRAFT_120970, partial [Lottia gigantea]
WSDWGTCSLTCGNGTQVRTRTCDGPHFGGKECDPPGSESQACNTHPCPGTRHRFISFPSYIFTYILFPLICTRNGNTYIVCLWYII